LTQGAYPVGLVGMRQFYGSLAGRSLSSVVARTDRGQTVIWLVGLLLTAVVALNEPIGKRISAAWEGVPWWWALVVVAGLLIYTFLKENYDAYRKIECRRDALEKDLEPKLRLVFDPIRYPSCEMPIPPDAEDEPEGKVCRLALLNLTKAQVEDVRVEVTRIDPQVTHFLPLRLCRMHETLASHADPLVGFTVNASGEEPADYIDVAVKRSSANPLYRIGLRYAGASWPAVLEPRSSSDPYTIALRATGRGMVPVLVRLRLHVNDDGVLRIITLD
jgi:hypothetical protein